MKKIIYINVTLLILVSLLINVGKVKSNDDLSLKPSNLDVFKDNFK